MAGLKDSRPEIFLSDGYAGHCSRHYLLLGRADDHGGNRIPRRCAVPRCLFHECHPRHAGKKNVEVAREFADPLDVIRDYGADALRFTILYLAPLGQDVLFESSKCEIGRNFANKIWNAGRFLMMNQDKIATAAAPDNSIFDFADKWIVSKLHRTIRDLNSALENFRINEATKIIYDFIWHDYCDWYLEMVKERLSQVSSEMTSAIILANAISIFESAIELLHPFMPFITEELHGLIMVGHENESITAAEFPEAETRFINDKIETEMDLVQEVITSIRAMRKEANVPPSVAVDIVVKPKDEDTLETLTTNESYIRRLAKVETFAVGFDLHKSAT